jgi:hypothetical protein
MAGGTLWIDRLQWNDCLCCIPPRHKSHTIQPPHITMTDEKNKRRLTMEKFDKLHTSIDKIATTIAVLLETDCPTRVRGAGVAAR